MFTGHVGAAQLGQVTRRTLTNMSIDDPIISTYRDFVGIMQSPPANLSANVNWQSFAQQHGSFETQEYKFCPHGDWYFLPWHRAYTLMYEKAAQVLTNNPAFAMPYWNWTEMRDYPEAFANPEYKGKPNPLFVPNRNVLVGQNALGDDIVGQALMDRIYRETVYEAFGTSRNPDQDSLDPSWVPAGNGFQGPLESRPHNQVHNQDRRLHADPRLAARPPVLHAPQQYRPDLGPLERSWDAAEFEGEDLWLNADRISPATSSSPTARSIPRW